jgi:polysaccharide biosynthesis transport protein
MTTHEIKRYWGLIRRRKYLALSVCLFVISIFTWGSFIWPKTYEANSTVFIQRSTMMDPLMKDAGTASSMEERLKTLQNGLTSRNIMERVIKKLDLDAEARTPQKLAGLIESMQKAVAVNVKSGKGSKDAADLFVISYYGSDPKRVRDVVNTLVEEYIAENLGFSRSDAYGAYEFIQNQLVEYKAKLEQSDRDIRSFREKNPNSIPQTETTALSWMQAYQVQKIDSDIKIQELSRQRDNIKKQLSGEQEIPVSTGHNDGSPQGRLNSLQNQLAILLNKYTPSHPEVLKTQAEIDDLRQQIASAKKSPPGKSGSATSAMNPVYRQLTEKLTEINAEIESLKTRSEQLVKQQRGAQEALGGMPKDQEEWSKLQRDRNVYQSIYDDLLRKLENAKVSKDLELTDKVATFKIVDPAMMPFSPKKPNRVVLIIAGIFLGIASGIWSAVVIGKFMPYFKDADAIEEGLGLRVLVSIPTVIDESAEVAKKRLDKKILVAALAYFGLILLVLMREVLYKYMGISLISF